MNRLTFVRLDDSEIQFLDTINSSLTMGPTLRQHSSLVSITYAPLCKSAYLWIIPWPFLLLLLWSRRVLIMLILYCLVVHTSISSSIHTAATYQSRNAAFSRSPLTSTEFLMQLHWLPIEWRIQFKLAFLVYKVLNTGHPP